MQKLHQIPVVVVHDQTPTLPEGEAANAVVLALLNEVEAKLNALSAQSETSVIDLHWLRGMPEEFQLLQKTLGQGEVCATILNIGSTTVQETAIPCVWWVSHRDEGGSRQGEFIEITEVPELLRSDRLSIAKGLTELRIRCEQLESSQHLSHTS